MEWEIPPHAPHRKYKLVSTEKKDGEIYLCFTGIEVETYYCSLNEVEGYSKEFQEYITDLLPKILSGVYDINLIKDV